MATPATLSLASHLDSIVEPDTVLSMVPCKFDITVGAGKVLGRGSAANSRSTSAGTAPSDRRSSSNHEDSPDRSMQAYPTNADGLPEYDYPTPWTINLASHLPETTLPAPLLVKNTFVGANPVRPPSLEEFYDERRTKSCPASAICAPPGLEDMVDAAKLRDSEVSYHCNSIVDTPVLHDFASASSSMFFEGVIDIPSLFSVEQFLPPAPEFPAPEFPAPPILSWQPPAAPEFLPAAPFVLELAQALEAPAPAPHVLQQYGAEVGSPELPTVGSQGHWFGSCKPCAFLYTKGCSSGVQCEYCHLCDPGEKKRRLQEKKEAFRERRAASKRGY